ncbi:MAG: winged helix-turn-helix domain-containing protein [Candidatus Anstonellales archaeon]
MLFIKEKPASVMLALRQHQRLYLSELAKKSNVTFAYIKKFIPLLEQLGIVTISKERKKTYVALTEKGKEIAKLLYELSIQNA